MKCTLFGQTVLQSLIKYSYAWNCVNNPTWKVSTFQHTDSVNNTMRLALSTNHQYVPCVINTNTKRERTGYLRVFLIRTRGITPELQLQALLKCAPIHTRDNRYSCMYELNLLELPPVKPFISKRFTRKFYKSFKALPCSCYMRNKALDARPRC